MLWNCKWNWSGELTFLQLVSTIFWFQKIKKFPSKSSVWRFDGNLRSHEINAWSESPPKPGEAPVQPSHSSMNCGSGLLHHCVSSERSPWRLAEPATGEAPLQNVLFTTFRAKHQQSKSTIKNGLPVKYTVNTHFPKIHQDHSSNTIENQKDTWRRRR